MHNGLLAESMSLEQQTQTALKDLMIAVQDAEKCGASVSELYTLGHAVVYTVSYTIGLCLLQKYRSTLYYYRHSQ